MKATNKRLQSSRHERSIVQVVAGIFFAVPFLFVLIVILMTSLTTIYQAWRD